MLNSCISAALVPTDPMHGFLRDKQAWENAISMYQGPDPLDHWYNYICWYENHARGDPENKFRETLERCLARFEHTEYYKQDLRMVRLWLKYIDMQPHPLHFYQVLYQRGVGRQVSAFYIGWASYYESIHALKEAESVYNLAFQEKAQSYEELHHAHNKFMYMRTAAAQMVQQQQQQQQQPHQHQLPPQQHSSPHLHHHQQTHQAHYHHQSQCQTQSHPPVQTQPQVQAQQPVQTQLHGHSSPQLQNYHRQQTPTNATASNSYYQPHAHAGIPVQQQPQLPQSQPQTQSQQEPVYQHQVYHSPQAQFQSHTQHVATNQFNGSSTSLYHNNAEVANVAPHTPPVTSYDEINYSKMPTVQIQAAEATTAAYKEPTKMNTLTVEGIKLPRKFASYCRNNYETWKPALFLEEPDDPCRRCHYAKHLVYPGTGIEYSPEELRTQKYFAARQERVRIASEQAEQLSANEENGYVPQELQEIGVVSPQQVEPDNSTYANKVEAISIKQHNLVHKQHRISANENSISNGLEQVNHSYVAQAADGYVQLQQNSVQHSRLHQHHLHHHQQHQQQQQPQQQQTEQHIHLHQQHQPPHQHHQLQQHQHPQQTDQQSLYPPNQNHHPHHHHHHQHSHHQNHLQHNHQQQPELQQHHQQSQPQQQQTQQQQAAVVNTLDDLEDQIEASTIRLSENKTIKIKFKKERQSDGNSLKGNNYVIENISQQEALSPMQDYGKIKNGHSFHPYNVEHTSTPKSTSKRSKTKLKMVNKFPIGTGGSSNSSSAENAAPSNGNGNGNGNASAAEQAGDSVLHNATFNDNANYSFSSAVALDASNCSLTSAVDRLNFRDTSVTFNTNNAEISTYQENSYFATQHDAEAKERRLRKALEIIDLHLAKESIDPFNSELCRAFLTKLNFPGTDDSCANYKIVQIPLPKIPNTRTLLLPDGVQFNIDKEVGRGSYGSVYKATDANTGNVVALKFQKPPNTWEIYICDQVLKRIKSPNVLPGLMDISAAVIAPNASLIATEFSPFGSLLDINNKIRQATTKVMHESLVMHFSAQICNIIHHLHMNKIIHADIKPDNFLLMRIPNTDLHYPSLRLIDFGCAIDMTLFPEPEETKFRKVIQTDGFTCIEMQEGRPWSYETDLFCIAGTVHVMLLGEYMQLQKRTGNWDIKQKLPRYLKKHVWTRFFNDMLNINSSKLPDLNEMRKIFEEEAARMDSELQSQIRTLSNILHRR